jgi:hypothetical protein
MAGRYVSKYVAKVDASDSGGSGQICDTDKTTKSSPKHTGRVWGCFNRERLPFAEHRGTSVPRGTWYHEFKKLASTEYDGIDPLDGNGFTLFTDIAEQMFYAGLHLANKG